MLIRQGCVLSLHFVQENRCFEGININFLFKLNAFLNINTYIGIRNPFQDGIVAKEDFKFGIFVGA